jgi:hypothetical protein
MSTPRRIITGTLGGAAFGVSVAAAMIALMFGLPLLLGCVAPMDRQLHLGQMRYLLSFAAVCGAILGTLAGFASRCPRSGVSFLRCCVWIAVAAGFVRLGTAPMHHVEEYNAQQFYFSYIASLAVAVLVTGILVWIGLRRESPDSASGGIEDRKSPPDG